MDPVASASDLLQAVVNRYVFVGGTHHEYAKYLNRTDYDPTLDLGRTVLKVRSLSETTQSLALTLEPLFPQEDGQLPSGELRIVWEDVEFSTNWSVLWP